MGKDIYYYRTKLLLAFTEKKYSQSAKHEIMKHFGKLKPEQKENAAKESIPLVQLSKTEQEAVTKIKQLVNSKIME